MKSGKEMEEFRELIKSLKPGDKFYTDFLSYRASELFIYLRFTPNQLSVLGPLTGIIGALFIITTIFPLMLLGTFLLIFAALMDSVDGEVARYRKYKKLPEERFRKHGGFFDWLETLIVPLVIIIFSIGFASRYESESMQLLIISIGLVSAVLRFVHRGCFNFIKSLKILPLGKYVSITDKIPLYNKKYLPFFSLFTIVVDKIFSTNLFFYYWISLLVIGFIGLFFVIKNRKEIIGG